jgi:hypothetical protein
MTYIGTRGCTLAGAACSAWYRPESQPRSSSSATRDTFVFLPDRGDLGVLDQGLVDDDRQRPLAGGRTGSAPALGQGVFRHALTLSSSDSGQKRPHLVWFGRIPEGVFGSEPYRMAEICRS